MGQEEKHMRTQILGTVLAIGMLTTGFTVNGQTASKKPAGSMAQRTSRLHPGI